MGQEGKYAYAVTRIRVLETRLLDRGKIDRMLDARDAASALRVLSETEYAEVMGELAEGERYEEILGAELKRVYQVVGSFSPDPDLIDLLRSRYDFQNIKVLLKAGHLGIDRDDLLVALGSIPPDRLKEMAAGDFVDLPPAYRQIVAEAQEEFKSTGDPQLIDLVIDRGMYDYLYTNARADFLRGYFLRLIDLTNIKTAMRLKRSRAGVIRWAFLPHGSVDPRLLLEAVREPWDAFGPKFAATDYAAVVEEGLRQLEAKGTLTDYECLVDEYLLAYLRQAKYVAFGPEPILAYLLAKELEGRLVRLIMVGKINNLPKETIKERLCDVYA